MGHITKGGKTYLYEVLKTLVSVEFDEATDTFHAGKVPQAVIQLAVISVSHVEVKGVLREDHETGPLPPVAAARAVMSRHGRTGRTSERPMRRMRVWIRCQV